MGILNVTPDSFFDGGRFATTGSAVRQGLAMAEAGADIVDVGGESSRPGAQPVSEEEELRRVVPVVEQLAASVAVSVDTVKPAVAAAAVEAGAVLINDVSASLWPVAAELGVGWIAMHRQGTPADMQADPRYDDVVREVREFLLARLAEAGAAGVRDVWVDPGIGFGKTYRHNLELLARLGELASAVDAAGVPAARGVAIGVSRKRSMGLIGRGEGAEPLEPSERLPASLAVGVWALSEGATMVRVHDVPATVQAARLVGEVAAGATGPGRAA
jgi:dihydropteroate synthase